MSFFGWYVYRYSLNPFNTGLTKFYTTWRDSSGRIRIRLWPFVIGKE